MEEIWKPIKGYEEMYEVSSLGRIKSLERSIVYNEKDNIFHCKKEKILKSFSTRGYRSIKLYSGFRKCKTILIHRLVAIAFIPNVHNLSKVNHKNGLKWDNRAENLEWVTHNYNVKHAYEIGLKDPKNYKGEGNKTSKLTNENVLSIRKEYSLGNTSYVKLSKKYDISHSNIFSIVKRQTWNHI